MKEVVIVTGSSGLIGFALSQRLSQRSFEVVGFDRVGPPYPPAHVDCVLIDLTSERSVLDALHHVRDRYGTRIASVVHLAAYYDFSGEPSDLYEQITVRGTERLLQTLGGFDVEQIIFSSTMLVHAPTVPGRPIDEDWPLQPKWDYPRSKVRTESLLQEHRGDIPLLLMRIAGVYDDGCHSLPLAHQMQRIYERRLVGHVFPGETSHGQAFVHLDDLIDAFVLAIDRRAQLPKELTLLIGEDQTLSHQELQESFGRLIHGRPWHTRQIPKPLAKAGAWFQEQLPGEEPFIKPWMIDLADDHYELNISRAKEFLGWQPRRSLRQTLPMMAHALKSDPRQFYRENKLDEVQFESGTQIPERSTVMQVREIMTENPECCSPDANLQEAARMMAEHDCGEIPVVDQDHKPVGVITDRDIACRAVAQGRDPKQTKVKDVMSSPVTTTTPDASLEDCCRTMEQKQVRRIPVVDESGSCCGIVAQADIALNAPEHETGEVVKDVSQPSGGGTAHA